MALIDRGTDPATTPDGTGYLGRPEGNGLTYGDPPSPPVSLYDQDASGLDRPSAEAIASSVYADGSGPR
jgi:hypothetical protein